MIDKITDIEYKLSNIHFTKSEDIPLEVLTNLELELDTFFTTDIIKGDIKKVKSIFKKFEEIDVKEYIGCDQIKLHDILAAIILNIADICDEFGTLEEKDEEYVEKYLDKILDIVGKIVESLEDKHETNMG